MKHSFEEIICNELIEMMETTPYSDISVTELVRRANISRSAFYIYFDSLDSVLQKIESDFDAGFIDENLITLNSLINNGTCEEFTPTILKSFEYLRNHLRIYRVLAGKNGDPSFESNAVHRVCRITQNLLKNSPRHYTSLEKRLIGEYWASGQITIMRFLAFNENNIDDNMIRLAEQLMYNDIYYILRTQWNSSNV